MFKGYEAIKRLYVIKKLGFRYRQAEIAGIAAVEKLERTAGVASVVAWLRKAHVAEQFGAEKPTQKLRSFFSRWSIKFSAEYYEEGTAGLRRPIAHSQYPSPQRYCQAIPRALNWLPVRVEMPVLAESFSELLRSTGRARVNPALVFRCSLSLLTPFRLV